MEVNVSYPHGAARRAGRREDKRAFSAVSLLPQEGRVSKGPPGNAFTFCQPEAGQTHPSNPGQPGTQERVGWVDASAREDTVPPDQSGLH